MHNFKMKRLVATAFLSWAVLALTDGCKDISNNCGYWKKYCKTMSYPQRYCKKSCGLCGGGGGGGDGGGGGGSGGSGSCGIRPSTRIVGGTQANPGDWPWQAQIRSFRFAKFPFCGGSLINSRWVISASHCYKSYLYVRLGAHQRSGKTGTEQDFKAIKIIKHKLYKKPFGMAHDIMLLKLDKPVKFNRYVQPVCLPTSIPDVTPGTRCWISGFGSLSSGGPSPDFLMQASVPIVSQAKCKRAYYRKIHESMICAGYDKGGIDSCQGDSGGPMVCESGGRYYLHGAISWGHKCAAPGKYGVYARIKYDGIMRWIQDTIKYN